MRPLLIALQFLTRLPVRLARPPEARELGRSVLAYPLVGALIGGLLLVPSLVLPAVPAGPLAALTLALWVALTGALHLDGLADCADGWIGGHGDRDRTLQIMKDPRSGSAAIAAVSVVLIAKFAALAALAERQAWIPLLVAPVLARAALPVLLACTPAASGSGLAQALRAQLPVAWAVAVSLLSSLAILLAFRVPALAGLGAAPAVVALLRRASVQRLGGLSGDVCGAVVELSETAILMSSALAAGVQAC